MQRESAEIVLKSVELGGADPIDGRRRTHSVNGTLLLTCDDHRCAGGVYHGRSDRPEQHSRESPAAVATDDDKLGRFRLLE